MCVYMYVCMCVCVLCIYMYIDASRGTKGARVAVLLDDVEDKVKVKVFKLDEASNSYIFEYRGLIPGDSV
jgi:hypothetical protein